MYLDLQYNTDSTMDPKISVIMRFQCNVLLYNRPVFSDTILQESSVDRTFISSFHNCIMYIMLTFIEFDGSKFSNNKYRVLIA